MLPHLNDTNNFGHSFTLFHVNLGEEAFLHLHICGNFRQSSTSVFAWCFLFLRKLGTRSVLYYQSALNPNTQLAPNKQLTLPALPEMGPNFMNLSLPPPLFTSFYLQCSDWEHSDNTVH